MRILQRPADHVTQKLLGHVHQHQAHQNFVGMKALPQPGHHPAPGHATSRARQQNRQHHPAAAAGIGHERHRASGHGPEDELPLGTDIPYIGAEAQRQPQADQQQGRGLEQQFAPGVAAFDGFPEKYLQPLHRIPA